MIQSLETTQSVKQHHELTPLETGWVSFIERFKPWHWFVTLTFKDDISIVRANRIVARFLRGMNEDLFGRRFRDKGLGLPYVNAGERQKRGTPHNHLLIGGDCFKLKRLKYKDLWEGWNGKTFTRYGMARVLPFDGNRTVTEYICKYVTKGGVISVVIPPYMYEMYGLKQSSNQSFKFV